MGDQTQRIEQKRRLAHDLAEQDMTHQIARELDCSRNTVQEDLRRPLDRSEAAAERLAIRADARVRLRELRRMRSLMWNDRDDAVLLPELVMVESQIRAAERVLEDA